MSDIAHACAVHGDLLVISFTGVYRIGSAGNPDADRMSAVVERARHEVEPRGIVLDLRGLDYRWVT